jgi:putative transposase
LNQKLELIDEFREEFSVQRCCQALELPRSTYYASQNRISMADKYDHLKNDLEQVIRRNPAYGYRRIQSALKNEYGRNINHKPLQKLLHEWDLALKRNIKKSRPSGIESILKEMGGQANILRTLKEEEIEPFRVFQTDFTEFYTETGKIYLMPYLDYRTKVVVAYHISLNADASAAVTALKKLKLFLKVQGIPLDEIISHQDQGSPYKSYDYVSALVLDDMTPSFSRVGMPGDNPGMESFFGRFKSENKNLLASARDIPELITIIEVKLRYYNHLRIHSKTNGRSPINNLPIILSK